MSSTDVTVTCGPHPRKRHGSDTATVARAAVISSAATPYVTVELFGVVEQREYRNGTATIWDEYRTPLDPDVARWAAGDRSAFDRRWDDGRNRATDPVAIIYGGEVAVRERSLLRCPVCAANLPVSDADALRAVLGRLAAADASVITLAGLRRALSATKGEGDRPMR